MKYELRISSERLDKYAEHERDAAIDAAVEKVMLRSNAELTDEAAERYGDRMAATIERELSLSGRWSCYGIALRAIA